jgi:hypothetical protein
MRLIIIKEDKFISIDDNSLSDIQQDFSWMPIDVRCVQWYDDRGEVEYTDTRPNLEISELGIYENAIKIFEEEQKRLKQIEIDLENSIDYWERLRDERNAKLNDTDWTQLNDTNLSQHEIEQWKEYRQKLRDLPKIVKNPKPLVLDPDHNEWPVIL